MTWRATGLIIVPVMLAACAHAQPASPPASPSSGQGVGQGAGQGGGQAASAVRTIPSPGGAVYIPDARGQQAYDRMQFAPARRAGDVIYVSGVIIAMPEGKTDIETFKQQARGAFEALGRSLAAAGVGFEHVAMISSFHVWNSPHFAGERDAQMAALAQVKAEFMPAPHPAWTAVGTTGLLAPTGIVEVQVIAHSPRRAP